MNHHRNVPDFWRSIVVSCILISAVATTPCVAGSGYKIVLPFNGQKLKNGIIAEIDTRWVDGFGYRPVKISLSARRAKRDRTIKIVLLPESHSSFKEPLRVEVEMEIPEGKKEVTRTFYIPQQSPWSAFRAEFYEGGRMLKDLSMTRNAAQTNSSINLDSPCLLIVDTDAPSLHVDRTALVRQLAKEQTSNLPDTRKFRFMGTEYQRRNYTQEQQNRDIKSERATDYETLTDLQRIGNVEIIPPTDLPSKYIGLSGVDLIAISLNDLEELAESFPERFQAVDYFIRNGGNLILFDAENVAEGTVNLFGPLKWTPANKLQFRNARLSFSEMVSPTNVQKPNSNRRDLSKLPDVLLGTHGMGRVATIPLADPYEENVEFWQWILASIGTDRLTWGDRHGISLLRANDDYWDFMIPGFGASPVESFLGVITLFIICIGPVNIWLLKKSKRFFLLPLTVGIAATLTTLLMLGYALVSDGISTRLRLNSYTELDQRTDQAVAATHSRHAYLAAIAPSGGLVFPDHTCVYPVTPYYDYNLEREESIVTRQKTRRLQKGYMRPRATMQFLTTNVEPTEAGVQIAFGGDGITIANATNGVGVPVTHAWIRDGNGDLYFATNTDVDQPFKLASAEDEEARQQYYQIALANKPKPPEGLDKTVNPMFMNGGQYRYYSNSAPPSSNTALLNRMINSHGSKLPNFFTDAKPNTYLLLTTAAPAFVHHGTDGKQMAGFHVIAGSW